MEKRKGFTLIELLVVISIIALLMAILIPALNAAKKMAAGSSCLSNQRTLSIAWFTYTVDNDGKLVGGDVLKTGTYTPSRSGEMWIDPPLNANHQCVADTSQCNTECEKHGIEHGGLAPYTKDVDVYHCPGDKRYQKRPTDPASANVEQNGGWRTYAIPSGLYGEIGVGGDIWCTIYSQIKNPSQKYVFVEEKDPRGPNSGSWALNEPQNYNRWDWTDPLAVWHNRKSTLGWADSHATMQRWVDQRTMDTAEWPAYDDAFKKLRSGHKNSPDLLFMKKHWAPGPREGEPKP